MDRIKVIFIYISFGLSYFSARGQQIGNYVQNGSFENLLNCNSPLREYKAIGWTGLDSVQYTAPIYNKTCGGVPLINGIGYQWPKDGKGFARVTWFCPNCTATFTRSNLKNRLKQPLKQGAVYCVKMYVTVQDMCPLAIDGFGFYFGDSSLDTILFNARLPLSFLSPQVSNPNWNIISDSMNWVPITGTFTANGTEKYMIVSNFKSDAATNTLTTGYLPQGVWAEYFIDAISCIEVNLPAYAGPDKLIYLGDSTFIGRQPDFATDTSCIWFKLPNVTTSIDTVSGLWVKPSLTSTYVVRQELDCGSIKWDTVVVAIDTIPRTYVGLDKLQAFSDSIILYPNPTSGNLNISFSGSVLADFRTYSISNTIGQMIREDDVELKRSYFIVRTSDLVPGLYQIHFKTQFGNVTKKFVKTD